MARVGGVAMRNCEIRCIEMVRQRNQTTFRPRNHRVQGHRESANQEADKSEPLHRSKQHFAMKVSCRSAPLPNRLNVEEYCCGMSILGADVSDVCRFGTVVIVTRNRMKA